MKFLNKKTILLSLGFAALALSGCDDSPNKYVGRYVNGKEFVEIKLLDKGLNKFGFDASIPEEVYLKKEAPFTMDEIWQHVFIKDNKVYDDRDNFYYGEFKNKNTFYFEATKSEYKRQ